MFELLEKLKQPDHCPNKIGFTCGTFDLLHPGHVMMLEESKANCDHLVVGLLSDPTISRPFIKNKPVQSMWERFVQLQSIKVVDLIVPFDTEEDIINMLEMIRPHIRFVGEEYKDKQFTGKDICNRLGIEIFYNRRSHKYSSTELRIRTEETPLGRVKVYEEFGPEQTKATNFDCGNCPKDFGCLSKAHCRRAPV